MILRLISRYEPVLKSKGFEGIWVLRRISAVPPVYTLCTHIFSNVTCDLSPEWWYTGEMEDTQLFQGLLDTGRTSLMQGIL